MSYALLPQSHQGKGRGVTKRSHGRKSVFARYLATRSMVVKYLATTLSKQAFLRATQCVLNHWLLVHLFLHESLPVPALCYCTIPTTCCLHNRNHGTSLLYCAAEFLDLLEEIQEGIKVEIEVNVDQKRRCGNKNGNNRTSTTNNDNNTQKNWCKIKDHKNL